MCLFYFCGTKVPAPINIPPETKVPTPINVPSETKVPTPINVLSGVGTSVP